MAAIGQSENKFTPMQLASYISTLANGGTRYQATFLSKVVSSDYKQVLEEQTAQVLGQVEYSEQAHLTVEEGMRMAAQTGTASAHLRDYPVPVSAKTGTAQITDARSREGRYYLGSMVAYFPADNAPLYGADDHRNPGATGQSLLWRAAGGPRGQTDGRLHLQPQPRLVRPRGTARRPLLPGHVKGGDIAQIRRVADKFSPRASFDQRTGLGAGARVDSLSNVIITSLRPKQGRCPTCAAWGSRMRCSYSKAAG